MKKIWQILLMLILIVSLTGCSEALKRAFISSEYEHIDLSETQFASDIEQTAEAILENPKNIKDFEKAARLFGSIGKLNEMDKAAEKYLNKDPGESALLLFKDCLKIRIWYEKKQK